MPKRRELIDRKGCPCSLCKLSRTISKIAERCTPDERAALDVLWTRMELAETRLEWIEHKKRLEGNDDKA